MKLKSTDIKNENDNHDDEVAEVIEEINIKVEQPDVEIKQLNKDGDKIFDKSLVSEWSPTAS